MTPREKLAKHAKKTRKLESYATRSLVFWAGALFIFAAGFGIGAAQDPSWTVALGFCAMIAAGMTGFAFGLPIGSAWHTDHPDFDD